MSDTAAGREQHRRGDVAVELTETAGGFVVKCPKCLRDVFCVTRTGAANALCDHLNTWHANEVEV